ncbi:hypothetical protein AVEN_71564-1 [Araneus ventricosus]|uniref:Uncharacterized protein n=1 Tax=Araneus ventricosus TaxID=182803 RepID=A0A4Y2P9R4_ARAVE|nr:hypothetical protein AVEN_71564-1 [Araneus ventricosus]
MGTKQQNMAILCWKQASNLEPSVSVFQILPPGRRGSWDIYTVYIRYGDMGHRPMPPCMKPFQRPNRLNGHGHQIAKLGDSMLESSFEPGILRFHIPDFTTWSLCFLGHLETS